MRTSILALALVALVFTTRAEEAHPFTEFFPAGSFGRGDKQMDASIGDWYASHLRAFKEPSIRAATEETYRFTMLPTLNFPLAVRVRVAPDGSGTAIVKRLTGTGGYKPGEVDFERTYAVTAREVTTLRATLAARKFWQMPTKLERSATDGTEWIFEAFRGGQYHVVTRHSPKDEDPFASLCLQLLSLGKLDQIDALLRERPEIK